MGFFINMGLNFQRWDVSGLGFHIIAGLSQFRRNRYCSRADFKFPSGFDHMKIVRIIAFLFCFVTLNAHRLGADSCSGPYTCSAHGNSAYGVKRVATGFPSEYATGNCAHCHEQHAGIDGIEPYPQDGAPSPFALFSPNFNVYKQTGPYNQSDNYCFYCHCSSGSLQNGGSINNYNYSRTFGGYTATTPNSIMAAFNGGSYHNLYDIWNFVWQQKRTQWNFFEELSNPCVACHNPHLAKRNKAFATNPEYTAISRPEHHDELCGDSAQETMWSYAASAGGTYRPPYMYQSAGSYEPAFSSMELGPEKTPDYNTFCVDCHNATNVIYSSTLGRNLRYIDWGPNGDAHGARPRNRNLDGSDARVFCNAEGVCGPFGSILPPYNSSPADEANSNYILSCLDCHEPHGSILDSYLLRKEVNNHVIYTACGPGCCGPGSGDFCQQEFCFSCHTHNHCGGPQGCFGCHNHGSIATTRGGWCGRWDEYEIRPMAMF